MLLWQRLQQSLAQQPGHCVVEASGSGAAWNGPQLLALAGSVADLLQEPALLSSIDEASSVLAIFLSNSAAYVVAVLAALQLGLTFLPLDPSWPPQRLQQVCHEAQPASVVWSAAAASCGGHGRPAVTGFPLVELPPLAGLLREAARREHQGPDAAQETAPTQQQQEQHPIRQQQEPWWDGEQRCCYLLFTSGSTGGPLGVRGTEAGVLNRCSWMQKTCPFQAGDRVAFKTKPTFVDSVWEVLGPLLAGATLAAVPQAVMRDPGQLLQTLAEQRITHLAAVPTLWRALASCMRQQPSAAAALKLRLAVSSGESLPPPLLAELQHIMPPGCCIWNLYGSTEVAADCTAFNCTRWQPPAMSEDPQKQQKQPEQSVPVGQPISGTLVAVLAPAEGGESSLGSSGRQLVQPAGSIGQVAVAGAALAAGYLCSHPAAAAAAQQRFVGLPTNLLEQAWRAGAAVAAAADLPAAFWQEESTRLFLTGDLGWLDSAGCLHLAGRKDLQVKIGGVRVDLAEVELALSQHPVVAAAAAKLWQLPAGPVLAAYAELRSSPVGDSSTSGAAATSTEQTSADDTSALQQWCRQRLPPAAVPQHVLVLPRLPRSAAGKVQRSELPASQLVPPTAEEQRGAGDARPAKRQRVNVGAVSELAVSRAFAAALGHTDFEATSNLFAIGGNSLMAAHIAGQVAGGDVEAVFRHPTVRSLAAFLNSAASLAETAAAGAAAGDGAAAATADRLRGGGGQVQAAHEQQQQQQLAARGLDVSGGDASPQRQRQQQQQVAASGVLRLAWRAKMLQCVDAAPLIEPAAPEAIGAPPGPAAAIRQQQRQGGRVLACSHGGDVCCYAAASGQRLWQTVLPDRTDAGLALCYTPAADQQQPDEGVAEGRLCVAAATNDGTLFFLEGSSGSIAGSIHAGGGMRAPPACDPWCGCVWQPTHGRQLLVAAAPGHEVARLALPAAASAAVSFDAEQKLALVCCLDGSLLAIAVTPGSQADSTSLQLGVAWEWRGPAPLFAPAAVLPGGGGLLAAAVDGSITALRSSDGAQLWRTNIGGAVFAPLLLLRAAEPSGGGQVLLVGTQAGQLAALEASSGRKLAAVELGAKVTGVEQLTRGQEQRQQLVVCLASGIVALLDLASLLAQNGGKSSNSEQPAHGSRPSCVLDAVQLPGDVFAAPAASVASAGGGGCVAVGCRDDHLYLLHAG